MEYAMIKCLECKREVRLPKCYASGLPVWKDGEAIKFCTAKCQRLFVIRNGQKEQKISMRIHAENLGMDVEDLPR